MCCKYSTGCSDVQQTFYLVFSGCKLDGEGTKILLITDKPYRMEVFLRQKIRSEVFASKSLPYDEAYCELRQNAKVSCENSRDCSEHQHR